MRRRSLRLWALVCSIGVIGAGLSTVDVAPAAAARTGATAAAMPFIPLFKEATEARSLLKSGIETRNAQFNRLIEQIEHGQLHLRYLRM